MNWFGGPGRPTGEWAGPQTPKQTLTLTLLAQVGGGV